MNEKQLLEINKRILATNDKLVENGKRMIEINAVLVKTNARLDSHLERLLVILEQRGIPK